MDQNQSREGGRAYPADKKERIEELLSLGLLQGTFYQSSEDIMAAAEETFEMALKEFPEYATECAIDGVEKYGLKLAPTLWLLHLSTLDDKSLFKHSFSRIIKNPPMLHTLLDEARNGNVRAGAGRVVKNAANAWLRENLSDYWACRYRTKLREIIRITRPKPDGASPAFQKQLDYIQNGTLSFPRIQILKAVLDDLAKNKVTELTLSRIEEERLQLEELKHQFGPLSPENKRLVFPAIFKHLNYGALVKNLATFAGIFQGNTYDEFIIEQAQLQELAQRIRNVDELKKNRMLPFPLLAAHELVPSLLLQEALEDALRQWMSGQELPQSELMVVVDASTSMEQSQITKSLSVLDVASLFGALLRHTLPSSHLYAIATDRREIEPEEDIFFTAKALKEANVGLGTKLAQMMEENPKGDILVITDSEMGDDLEEAWLQRGTGQLIIWQMVNSNLRVSKHPSVIYLQGYSEETWAQLYALLQRGGK